MRNQHFASFTLGPDYLSMIVTCAVRFWQLRKIPSIRFGDASTALPMYTAICAPCNECCHSWKFLFSFVFFFLIRWKSKFLVMRVPSVDYELLFSQILISIFHSIYLLSRFVDIMSHVFYYDWRMLSARPRTDAINSRNQVFIHFVDFISL